MELRNFQDTMREIYLERDEQRGVDATFRWLTEELGELARAIRTSERTNLELEFSDVLAWLTSLANASSVPGKTAVFGSVTGAKPRVPVPKFRVTNLSPIFAARERTLCKL